MFRSEDGKTLWELVQEGTKPESRAMANSKLVAASYFWIVAFTTPYMFITYVLPTEFSDASVEKIYWLKVLIIWLTVECMANWLCSRLTSSVLEGTTDRPVKQTTIWEGDDTSSNITKDPNFCKICKLVAPYGSKTHHCKMCDKCILKRDHHCYLLGTCVGYYNQRYFAILLFYMGISSVMCCYYFRRYALMLAHDREDFYWTEHILPLTIKHFVFGRLSGLELVLVFYCYTFVWTSMMGCGMFIMQMTITFCGQTAHEFRVGKEARAYRTISQNFQEVFGPCWITNFILPMQLVFKQSEFERPMILSEATINGRENGGVHVLLDMENYA